MWNLVSHKKEDFLLQFLGLHRREILAQLLLRVLHRMMMVAQILVKVLGMKKMESGLCLRD